MKRSHKIWLLILTILPLLIIPIMVFWIIAGGIQMDNMANPEQRVPFFVGGIVLWAILIGLISLGVWVYYLVHVINNKQIDDTERLIWVLLFIFVSLISHLVYFFLRIWNEPEREQGLEYTEVKDRN